MDFTKEMYPEGTTCNKDGIFTYNGLLLVNGPFSKADQDSFNGVKVSKTVKKKAKKKVNNVVKKEGFFKKIKKNLSTQ